MPLNSSAVRVAGTGAIHVGALDSVVSSASATPSASFLDLGYTSEDGVSISKETETEDIMAWQSLSPVRRIFTGQTLSVSTTLIQSQKDIVSLWWGASFVANGSEQKADLPAIPVNDERALLVTWVDNGTTNRLYIPRASVTETGDVSLNRSEAVGFELTWEALAPASGPLATWFVADTNFSA